MRAFIRLFQSRYRAASHFRRLPCASLQLRECVVSISLSSGFSFQGNLCRIYLLRPICFNLVIERLLISGPHARSGRTRTASVSISLSSGFSFQGPHTSAQDWLWRWFQSRYRAASHFRVKRMNDRMPDIEFQSRYRAASHFRFGMSTNSCLSFRFQSRYRAASHFRADGDILQAPVGMRFNLVIERLLISGVAGARGGAHRFFVSISLSSGFSFQVRLGRVERARAGCSFNLVIERLLISGSANWNTPLRASIWFQSRYRAASHFRPLLSDPQNRARFRFNLVIERLLISGATPKILDAYNSRFNLVIERLLISGFNDSRAASTRFLVSISLSSGFSFQAP